jgi:hypothetical protein
MDGRSRPGWPAVERFSRVRGHDPGSWERLVKKGRHRRFEEARSLKRAFEVNEEPCPECGAAPGAPHASWCLHDSEELEDEEEEDPTH